MLMDYPSNSNKSKDAVSTVIESPPETKAAPMVASPGKALGKKPGKISEKLGLSDWGVVKKYIFDEVFVPAAKKTILDLVSKGLEMYFGVVKAKNESSSSSTLHYREFFRDSPSGAPITVQATPVWNYGSVEVLSQDDAERAKVLINEIIETKPPLRVGDLYEIARVRSSPSDYDYGWYDVVGMRINRLPNGHWVIDMPKPVPIMR